MTGKKKKKAERDRERIFESNTDICTADSGSKRKAEGSPKTLGFVYVKKFSDNPTFPRN